MALNELPEDQLIAARRYIVRRGAVEKILEIGIGTPYSPAQDQNFPNFSACPVYFNLPVYERREVLGRDQMEALSHALLAIEARLLIFIRSGELLHEDGSRAEALDVGMFFGEIGSKYRLEFKDFGIVEKES